MKTTTDNGPDREMGIINDFLLNISDLEKLDPYISRINIFDILGIVRTEIRHSNMLAWLLDANGNHGLGDIVARRFVNNVIRNNTGRFDPKEWFFIDYDSMSVERELYKTRGKGGGRNFLDIVLFFEDVRNNVNQRYLIAIENKIDSGEGRDQTQRYREILEKEYGETHKQMYVFLSAADDEPKDAAWVCESYVTLKTILEEVLTANADKMNETSLILLKNYLEIIRSNIMNDDLAELCTSIYKKHKEAFDLIYEYKNDPELENKLDIVRKAMKKLMNDNKELGIIYDPRSDTRKTITFYLEKLNGIFPPDGDAVKYHISWIASRDKAFQLVYHPDRLSEDETKRFEESRLKTTNKGREHRRSESMKEFAKIDERDPEDEKDIEKTANEIKAFVEDILKKID